MVQYKAAALTLLLTTTTAHSLRSTTAFLSRPPTRSTYTTATFHSRHYSAIPYDDDRYSTSESPTETAMQIVESQIDNFLPTSTGDDEEVATLLAKKEERLKARMQKERKTPFRVLLPIVRAVPPPLDKTETQELATLVAKGQEIAVQNTVGMSLRQVSSGRRLSELALDVDTLRFQSFVDELQGRSVMDDSEDGEVVGGDEETRNRGIGSIQVLQKSGLEMIGDTFDGVLVSSVARGGLAWMAGVRAGDVLIGTSATIGNVSFC
jgi:hypothetical protein